MKMILLLAVLAGLCAAAQALAGEPPSLPLSDFQDPADLNKWTQGDSGAIQAALEPRAPTDGNIMMKVVFKGGAYPGFALKDVPRDWSKYEALSFVVWTESPYALSLRVDDAKSTDYPSRFNKTFRLEKGRNLCQVTVEEIGRVLKTNDIRALILFAANPPAGLTMWFDDILLGPRQAEQVPFVPYEQRKDLQPTMKVVTPHLPMARNLSGGPLRAFVLSGVTCGREVVELMQRLDVKVSLMTWDSAWDQNTWGMGDFYGQRGHAFDRVLMRKYFTSSMQGPEKFDAIILPTPIGWKEFAPEARAALAKRVKEDGEGLVLVHPFPGEEAWPEDLKELSALVDCASDTIHPDNGYLRQAETGRIRGNPWQAKGEHAITRGVPLAALPFEAMTYQQYRLAPGAQAVVVSESGDPIVAVRQVGKGRVVTCAWMGTEFTPAVARPSGAPPNRPYRYQEVLYGLIARCALWAAGRDLARQGEPVALKVEGENADPNLSARQWLKDGKVTDFELVFTPPGADGVVKVDVTVPKDVPRGRDVRVRFVVPPGLSQQRMTLSAVLGERARGRWRTLETRALEYTPRSNTMMSFDLPTARARQILALVKVEGRMQDKVAFRGEAEVVVTPPGEPWDDYEVFMWPVDGLPFLREMEDVRMVECGSTGVMDTGWGDTGRLLRWSRAGLRVLPHNADVRPLHIRPYEFARIVQQYQQTGDRKFLIRPASYADPQFLAAARQRMADAAAKLKPFFVPCYVLCDEPSLTSYRAEFDFDFHPANIQGFRRAMKEKFGSVEDLNAALGAKVASFDALHPPTTDEARKAGNWGLWNEWRAHNDTVMAEGYRMYRDALRTADPAARISVSGTQTANPFDAFDWSKLSPYFDAMNGYGYGEQERKRMSFYDGAMKNAKPAGYGNTGKGVAYQLWSSLTDHGCGHVLFWWVSFRNPDLSFCRSAVDYRKGFLELRAGIGRQYQLGRRHLSPVAIQYSMNSMRAAWATGRFDPYTSAVQNVTDALVAQGLDPVFISDEQLAAGDLSRRGFKAVFLPMGLSLGRGQKTGGLDVDGALVKFARSGGLVVATDEAEFDEFLQPAKPEADLPLTQGVKGLAAAVKKFADVKDDLGAVLAKADVKPWTPVVRPDGSLVPGLSVTVHRLSGRTPAYLVTLLRRPIGQKEVVGADGVLTYQPDPAAGNEVEPCVVDLSGLGLKHCTAVRTGQGLESKDGKVSLQMPSGDGLPLAVLPYAIKGVDFKTELSGRDLILKWQLFRDGGTGEFAPHAVRIEVGDASGPPDPALSANATSDASGAGTLTIPLAQEDAGRTLKVAVRDVLTGAGAQATVKVP